MKKQFSQKQQQKIGYFIRSLRERKGLTQQDFADILHTSQSAIARIESGNQNLSTALLSKISEALEHKILSIDHSIDFQIEGGRKLHGVIQTNVSKNGAMGLLCASLLNKGTTILHGIPRIEEVFRLIEVFESIGISVEWTDQNTLTITPPRVLRLEKLNNSSAEKTRSALMLIGSLIHRTRHFSLPHAGGCKMGERSISTHRYALEKLGVRIITGSSGYEISTKSLHPGEIVLYEASDTAAENVLIAAAGIPGKTTISFAPPNYQVQEVCFFLEKLGARIEGIGTHHLVIHGIKEINEHIEYYNSEDPIESMMFISAALTTGSTLTITRCPYDFLKLELLKLEKMGARIRIGKEYPAKNGRTKLVDITVQPSRLRALKDKIHALPYPGINSDNLPFFVPIATQARGSTLIHDWMWENRAIYFTELNRLGADITLADPHRVFIQGATPLRATQVVCPPALRPAMIILIAMLAAPGISTLRNIYSINRGYEEIAKRLNAIGARISVINN